MDRFKQYGLLITLLCICLLFYITGIHHFITFDKIKSNHTLILNYVHNHSIKSTLSFIIAYVVLAASSIPIAGVLTIASGLLFGTYLGTLYVVFSASLGSYIAFIAYKTALRTWVKSKMGEKLRHFEKGFHDNAFRYCFLLRLAPIFPFWTINMAMALLGMKQREYIISTTLGIIPCTWLYVYLGSQIGEIIRNKQHISFDTLSNPSLTIPLICLIGLSIAPLAYRKFRKK